MNLVKPCCWTTIFQRDEKVCGLILVYQTGEIEIRCSARLFGILFFFLHGGIKQFKYLLVPIFLCMALQVCYAIIISLLVDYFT